MRCWTGAGSDLAACGNTPHEATSEHDVHRRPRRRATHHPRGHRVVVLFGFGGEPGVELVGGNADRRAWAAELEGGDLASSDLAPDGLSADAEELRRLALATRRKAADRPRPGTDFPPEPPGLRHRSRFPRR